LSGNASVPTRTQVPPDGATNPESNQQETEITQDLIFFSVL